ncbi:MAG TPA: tetratricopeptide repeat protein [Pyrinomonadaceae bacterium]|jgi:tetratricopeptide (TPR) repeat protein|nr:tetratricopeptide repeat protein [Pyrinomonadaceae bacterium]
MPASLRQTLPAALIALTLLCACAPPASAQDDDSDDPVRLFERAQDAHAKGETARAVELYDAALKLRPEFAEAHYQKGVALVALKRAPEAEGSLRRAAELKADWALPQAALGQLLLRANRAREAEPFLRRAFELDPKNLPALIALARLHLGAGANADALKFIRQATESEGATAADWALRAQVERLAGDKDGAASSVARALKIDPRSSDAHAERAEQLAAAGDLRAAGEELTLAVDSAPEADRERLRQRLGEFEAGGRINDCGEGSITALEQLVAKDQKNASAHNCLGIAYRRLDPRKSLDHFGEALRLEPQNAGYATGYAAALVQLRRFAEAVAVLRRVVEARPDLYEAHANLATALDELKQFDQALAEFKWLRDARPELAVVHFFIARDYDLLGEFEQALAEYETFLATADAGKNALEIEKVKLRLPSLRSQIKRGMGVKRKKPAR